MSKINAPEINSNPDLRDVISATQMGIDDIVSGEWNEDRADRHTNAIYEAIMTAFYGEKYWEWFDENAYKGE